MVIKSQGNGSPTAAVFLPKYNETPEEKRIRTEMFRTFDLISSYYDRHIWPKWIQGYKDYLLYNQDRAERLLDFQENLKVPVVKMYVDALWKAIYDNNFNFHVSGRYKEYHAKAESAYNFLAWAFGVSNSRTHIMQALKETLILGNGYGKIGMHIDEKKIKFYKDKKWVTIDQSEKYPFLKYRSAFDIFIDPSCESIDDSLWLYERKIMHMKDIVKQYKTYCSDIEQRVTEAQKQPYYFFQYDFNRVKYLAFHNGSNQTMDSNRWIHSGTSTSSSWNLFDATLWGKPRHWNSHSLEDFGIWFRNFTTVDYAGGYSEVIEKWEDDSFVLMIDWRIIYQGVNPNPVKKKPYIDLYYNKIPWLWFGQWLSITLGPIQAVVDKIFNLAIDNMKLQVAPMFQKIKGADIFTDGKNMLTYSPFKIWETNTPWAIQRLDLGVPDFTWTNFVDFLMKFWEMSEGINSYTVGYQGKVERSATGVSALVQASKASLLPLVDSLNIALAKISEIWMVTAVVIMDPEMTLKVQDKQGKIEFQTIKMEDLLWKFDIEFDAQALKTATRETRRAQLMELLTLAPTAWFDQSTQQFFIDMRKIWSEVLDSFELDATGIILESKEVFWKIETFKKEQVKSNQNVYGWQPWQSPFAPWTQPWGEFQNIFENAPQKWAPWISPVSDGGSIPIPGKENVYPEGPPESQVLKEAFQI